MTLSGRTTCPSAGSDPNLGTVYENTNYAPYYCDNGAGGTDVFRIDGRTDSQNCASGDGGWSVNYPPNGSDDSPYFIPAVQFNAVATESPTFTSANSASGTKGQSFSFTVTTTGVPAPSLTKSGKLPHGLSFVNNGDGTATISGTPKATDRAVYHFKIKARNSNGLATQKFTLNLS